MQLSKLQLSIEHIQQFCQRWKITEFALFGSVLRDDFKPESDIDVLVTFHPAAGWTLLDLVSMQSELEKLAGREVDLIEKRAIENSQNWIRRNEILSTAKVVYSQTHEPAR